MCDDEKYLIRHHNQSPAVSSAAAVECSMYACDVSIIQRVPTNTSYCLYNWTVS
jgi:hypothetical protein